ncbi:MAG: hypothetical protein ABJQ85_04580 [Rhizobiaceae bacterium]
MALDIGDTGFRPVSDYQLLQVKRCFAATIIALEDQFMPSLQQLAQGEAVIVQGNPVQVSKPPITDIYRRQTDLGIPPTASTVTTHEKHLSSLKMILGHGSKSGLQHHWPEAWIANIY